MAELELPWLTLLLGIPAILALTPTPLLTPRGARRLVVGVSLIELLMSLALLSEFQRRSAGALVDPLDPGPWMVGRPLLMVDELSSLLLPFGALLFAFIVLSAPRVERARASTRRFLAAESVTLGTFATVDPLLIAFLWAMSTLNAYLELRSDIATRPTARAVGFYMTVSVVLFTTGVVLSGWDPLHGGVSVLLLVAVLIRKGIFPFHSWVTPLFEHMPLSAAALFAAPQLAAYATVRLIIPSATEEILSLIGLASLATALYGAALSLVATDARRALGAFFMSQSALIMAGLDSRNVIGLAGGLVLWISSGLALAGFTMTVAALEARRGPLSLTRHHGSYEQAPLLAAGFLVLGLVSVGFPGTLGFAGEEALAHGAFTEAPLRGAAALLASALNGITVMRCYFYFFCGARAREAHQGIRLRERVSIFALVLLLLAGGVFPQPFLASRMRAAQEVLELRKSSLEAGGSGGLRQAVGAAERAAVRP